MATKAPAKAAASGKGNAIVRKRRNSLTRQSLPKYLKTIFAGGTPSIYRAVLVAWKDSRKKVSPGPRD